MSAAKQAIWLFLALIGLSCSGWYFASSSTIVKLDETTLSTTPDMIVHTLTVRQFDANGLQVNYLQTPLLHHTQQNNTHWLKTPHVIIVNANQKTWDIQSKQALALHGGETITFTKEVIIHQKEDAHTSESTISTEELTYFPKDKLATSPLKVTYKQQNNQVEAVGMRAYLNDKRVQLLSQARGTYAPTA